MTINTSQKACLSFFCFLIAFWIFLFIEDSKYSFSNYFFVFLYGLMPFVGGIAAMVSSRLWGGLRNDIGKAVFLIGFGLFFWGCGQSVWAYYNFVAGIEVPYPSLADFFFAPSVFFYSIGTVYLAKTTGAGFGLKKTFGKIFCIITPLIILGISYYILIVVARGGQFFHEDRTFVKIILDIAYPLGDFIALSVSVVVSGLSLTYLAGGYKFDIITLMVGLAFMFVADFIFSYTTTVGTAYNGSIGDLAFVIGLFLLTFGVLGFNKLKNTGMND